MTGSPWMALIWLGGLAVSSPALAQSRPAENPPAENAAAAAAADPWASPEVAAPNLSDDLIRRPHASGVAATSAGGKSALHGLARSSAALAGVVALIVLLAWGYRAVSGASGRLGQRLCRREPGLIQILGRTSLGPRQALCLVRVGPQLVLLGSTHDSLRALTVVQDADLAARLAGQHNRPAGQGAEFQTCLESEAQAYAEPAPERGRAREPLAQLGNVKDRLSQTLRRLEEKAAGGV